MKKFLALLLVLVIGIGAGIGGTVAYLTDTESEVNVMTVGNVDIEQHEYERIVENGEYKKDTIDSQTSYVLKDFTQDKPIYPIVGDPSLPGDDPGYAGWDATTVRMSQVKSYGGMQVFAGVGAQDKFVTVENTGVSDAYVRTLVAIEIGSTDGSMIGTSYHSTWESTDFDPTTTGVDEPLYAEIDGQKYMVKEYVYQGATDVRHENGILPAGETSYPSLAQVYMNAAATNEDVKAIDGDKNGELNILVLSQAVQTANFEKLGAKTALDTAFGAVTEENVAEWFFDVLYTYVGTADELVEALEAGENVVLTDDVKIDPAGMSNAYGTTGINVKNGQTIDGGGNTLDIKGAGGTWDSGINTTGGLIRDLTVTGSFRGIFINHNSDHSEPVILKNVTIDGTTYTISCDQGMNQTLTATDSTFNGWTSFAATLGNAKFVDCYFGEGNGYAYCRPYAPTEFVNCEFEEGYTLDPRADVVFENCTLNGVALTDANIAELVTDTTKATVK